MLLPKLHADPSRWHGGSMGVQRGGKKPTSLSKDLVVFSILRDSTCAECGTKLPSGAFLYMDGQRPLCLACADLDQLVYLPSGDAALTRRARKHSRLSAVVVRFSRSRKRYERQGVLVAEAGLQRAEEECLQDADQRVRRRERDQVRRATQDRDLVDRMTAAILTMFPGCPSGEARDIAEHTAVRGSGRVGRSAAGQALDEGSLTAAVIAHVRHCHTRYDELLMAGWDRRDARQRVQDVIDQVLGRWRNPGSAEQ